MELQETGLKQRIVVSFEEESKTIAYAVNSLIDDNSSHRIFHNSASESVITSGKKKKTFR